MIVSIVIGEKLMDNNVFMNSLIVNVSKKAFISMSLIFFIISIIKPYKFPKKKLDETANKGYQNAGL